MRARGMIGAPYGLTEHARDAVRGAEIVANPGCYPTVTLLALLPLVVRGLVAPGATITVNAASGVTGAGFTPRRELMFAEVAEDFRPYAIGNEHRHLAEMRAVLASLGCDADLIFTPHLLPVARGILATITVPLAEPLADALAPWREHYAGEPFIEVSAEIPVAAGCGAPERRAHDGDDGCGRARADADRGRGDRQSREGRGGAGAAERESAARAR